MEDVLVDLKDVEGIPETFSGVCNIEIMNIYKLYQISNCLLFGSRGSRLERRHMQRCQSRSFLPGQSSDSRYFPIII